MLGYQSARTDSSYAGLYISAQYIPGITNSREYLACQLTNSLTANDVYIASYYVSLSDSTPFAAANLQMWITDSVKNYGDSLFNPHRFIRGTPQVTSPQDSFLRDTVGWMQVCDTFTATGAERYLLIGNFTDSALVPAEYLPGAAPTDSTPYFPPFSYYYIDDVSLYRVPGGLAPRSQQRRLCAAALPDTLRARAEYLRYRWSTGDTTSTLAITAPGTYWVEQIIECTSVVDTYHVAIETPTPPPNLGEDRYHCRDDQVQPVTLDAGEQPNYRWSTGETTRQITVFDSGRYAVEVTYDRCETRRDTVHLRGCPPNYDFTLTLPNVITPNGDAVNEVFQPIEQDNLTLTRLRVYDRWGRMVHQQTGPTLRWDGRQRGRPVPAGIYYYVMDFRRPVTDAPDQQRGSVTVLR